MRMFWKWGEVKAFHDKMRLKEKIKTSSFNSILIVVKEIKQDINDV